MKPLFLEVGLLHVIFATYLLLLTDEVKVRVYGDAGDENDWLAQCLTIVSFLPFLPLLRSLCQLCREKNRLIYEMRNFELAKVSCRVSSDRNFIYAGIREWYGSEEAFEEYVRHELSEELTGTFLRWDFPAVYWLLMVTPMITAGVDLWLQRVAVLKASTQVAIEEFLGWVFLVPLTFVNILQLCFVLCDLAATRCGICRYDLYAKAMSIWLLMGLLFVLLSQATLDQLPVEMVIFVCACNLLVFFLLRRGVPKMLERVC